MTLVMIVRQDAETSVLGSYPSVQAAIESATPGEGCYYREAYPEEIRLHNACEQYDKLREMALEADLGYQLADRGW